MLHLRFRRPLRTACVGFAFFAIPPALLAMGVSAGDVAAGALFAGLAASLGNTLWETALQRHIPRRALSRVSAYDWLVSLALAPIGQLLVGPVSAAIGIDATLWVSAAIFVTGTVGTLSIRQVRDLNGEVAAGAEAVSVEP